MWSFGVGNGLGDLLMFYSMGLTNVVDTRAWYTSSGPAFCHGLALDGSSGSVSGVNASRCRIMFVNSSGANSSSGSR